MTTYVVIEGRKPIEVPQEIADDEQAVVKALVPFYPQAAEAEIKREDGPEQGDVTLKVIPQGKTKGVCDEVLAHLKGAPPHINPAVALCLRIESEGLSQPETLIALKDEIATAITRAEAEIDYVDTVLRALCVARAVPAVHVPMGF
jgi:hypothetical protein